MRIYLVWKLQKSKLKVQEVKLYVQRVELLEEQIDLIYNGLQDHLRQEGQED
jgi:uncharacterized protein Yka (UPF0111/DUF47 family)